MNLRRLMSLLCLSSLLLGGGSLRAQSIITWTGLGTDGNITDIGNWVSIGPASGDNLVFTATAGHTAVLVPTFTVTDITIGSLSPAYTFNGTGTTPVLTLNGNLSVASTNSVTFLSGLTVALGTGDHSFDTGSTTVVMQSVVNGAGNLTKDGTGTLTLSGANTYAGGTTIKAGTVAVNAGSISQAGAVIFVGDANLDSGTLAISAGATVTSATGWVGHLTGSAGFVTIDGTGSTWTNATSLAVGNLGYGELQLSNGGTVTVAGGAGTLTLASGSGSTGYLFLGGSLISSPAPGGIVNAATINTGSGDSGTIEFFTTGTSGSPYYLTKDGTSTGTGVAITGPTDVHINTGYTVFAGTGSTYTGETTLYGGTLADANANAFSPYSIIGLQSASSGLVVNFNETIGGLEDSDGSAPVVIASGATLTIDDSADGYTSAPISGAGALAKTGPGILTLGGASSYSGGTTITGGTLNVMEDSALGTGPVVVSGTGTLVIDEYYLNNPNTVQVNSGGRLAGKSGGYQYASINAGGTLAPGTEAAGSSYAIATLGFDDLTLGQNGTFEINVRSNGAGGFNFDQASVFNAATLTINATPANRFTLKVISLDAAYALGDLGGLTPGNTYSWLIFDTNGILDVTSGTSTITPGSFLVDTSAFTTALGGAGLFTVTQTGYDIFLNFTAIPEPSTYALMVAGFGFTGLAAWRRKRASRRSLGADGRA